MFKSWIVRIFLREEVDALRRRLAEASHSLDRIQSAVNTLPKEAPPEAHALGETVLRYVLSSADKVRSRAHGHVNGWEQKMYADYETGRRYTDSTIMLADRLTDKSKLFSSKR